MQIHELNTFSGTPGANDYFATDNGADTSKISAENLLAPLNERIDNIIAGPAPSAEEIVDARLGADGVTYPSLGDAIRGQVENLQGELDYIAIDGINLFDKSKASVGHFVNLSGNVGNNANFFCSDFIPVLAGNDYDLIGVGSASTYSSATFYDASKTFLSNSFYDRRANYTVTTPNDCAYVRINGVAANIDNAYLVQSNERATLFSPYRKVISGISSNPVQLLSSSAIRYNHNTGELYSLNTIFLLTKEKQLNLGTSINVGIGSFLYWNKATGELYASNNYPINDNNVYYVCLLANQTFEPMNFDSGVSAPFPIFRYDLVNSKLFIRTNSYSAIVFDKGTPYTIPAQYEQDIDLPDGSAFVCFDPKNVNFSITSSIGAIKNFGLVYIATKSNTSVESIAPFIMLTNENNLSTKRIMTWGDSLTWYDGQEFTWGEHQGEVCVGYQSYFRKNLGFVVHQLGSSGKTTPGICNLIKNNSLDFNNYDYMTIMSGDNDDRLSVPIGTLLPVGSEFDTTTVIGALQSAVEYSLSQNPNLRIIIMSEPMGWTYVNGTMKRVSSLIPNALRQVAEQYGLPFIDLWSESGINEMNRETFYADPAPADNHLYMYHPNNDGWERISKVICRKILDY